MLPEDKEKLNKIEELKSKLFNKNYQARPANRIDFVYRRPKDIPDSWEKAEEEGSAEQKIFLKTSKIVMEGTNKLSVSLIIGSI